MLAQVLEVGLQPIDAVWFYWLSWCIAIATRIVDPADALAQLDRERRRVPRDGLVGAAGGRADAAARRRAAGAPGGSRLAREFSAVNQIPAELRNLPSPSGVHRAPPRVVEPA